MLKYSISIHKMKGGVSYFNFNGKSQYRKILNKIVKGGIYQ